MRRMLIVVALAGLCGPTAATAAVKPTTCATLAADVNAATAGEVLQLPPGVCQTNLTVTDTTAFTLEGAPSRDTVLQPQTGQSGTPIISSSADVHFTLTRLLLVGTTGAPALSLFNGGGEAVTVKDVLFAHDAGGIDIEEPGVTTKQPTVITGNLFGHDRAAGGGGVTWSSGQPIVISGNTFADDSASSPGVGGGGIYVIDEAPSANPVQIAGNTFGGQAASDGDTTAGQGAGAYIWLGSGQPLTLTGNTFEHDRVTGTNMGSTAREGGGLFLGLTPGQGPYPVTQSHNVFSNNVIDETEAPGSGTLAAGGAGEWISGLRVTSTADKFIGNRVAVNDGAPPEGGGVGAIAAAAIDGVPVEPAGFTGRDDLFSGNSTAAGGWGGAIYVGAPTPDCTIPASCPGSAIALYDSTVVRNSVDSGSGSEGGAIWGSLHDRLSVTNSIVYGNEPKPEIFWPGVNAPVFAYSDVCTEAGGPRVRGKGNICAVPKLRADGTERHGPTVAAGSVALIPVGLKTDLAGKPRTTRGFTCGGPPGPLWVDIGAFEAPALPLPCPVRIRGTQLVDKHGQTAVKLSCGTRRCVGKLTINHGKLRLGSAHFRIAAKKTVTIEVKLSAKALSKLGKRSSVAVIISVQFDGTTTASGTLRLPQRHP